MTHHKYVEPNSLYSADHILKIISFIKIHKKPNSITDNTEANTGSDDDLAPKRQQDIPWANIVSIKWHIYATPLTHWGRVCRNDIFNCVLNENVCISFKIPLKLCPKVRINNSPALVQIMAWRRPGDKPLSEPMMVSLLTYICVTRPQRVNRIS